MNEQTAPVTEEAEAPDYKSMYEDLRDILMHNEEMSSRAPVRGVSGGAPAEPPADDFTRGFDSDTW